MHYTATLNGSLLTHLSLWSAGFTAVSMYQPENFITNANQTNDEPGKATTAQLCWTFLIYSTTVVWLVRVSGHPRRHFRGDTGPSHGFPYVVEVEHDGPAILGQPPGIQFAPSNDVLL